MAGSWLTQGRGGDRDVGFRPYLSERCVNCGGFFLFPLAVEGLRKTEKRPAVCRQPGEILSIDLFGLSKASLPHERGTERVPRRQNPAGRFTVTQRVLGLHRLTKFRDTLINLAVTIKNFTGQHRSDDGEDRLPGIGPGGFFWRHEKHSDWYGLPFPPEPRTHTFFRNPLPPP